jgi:hypothetical protein
MSRPGEKFSVLMPSHFLSTLLYHTSHIGPYMCIEYKQLEITNEARGLSPGCLIVQSLLYDLLRNVNKKEKIAGFTALALRDVT